MIRPYMTPRAAQAGFTLVEAVMVIVITGVIAAIVAVFIVKPVEGYVDTALRSSMTDSADTAVRRIARDVRLALPNSVRVTGSNRAIEFLRTRTGGRYLVSGTSGNPLDFQVNDTSFGVIGPGVTMADGDEIVIYNLGIDGANAYSGNTAATDNRRTYAGGAGLTNVLSINSTHPFPLESPARRFHVVDTPVSYICDPAARTLMRYWGYAIQANQPNPPGSGNSALLATNVSDCIFTYTSGVTESSGLVSMRISLQQATKTGGTETITLYHEVHVNNVP